MKTLNIILHSVLQVSLMFVTLPQAMAQEIKQPLYGEPGFGFGFGLLQPTLTNTITKGWQLTAELEHTVVKLGEPVILTLQLRNMTSVKLDYDFVPWYDFKITDAVGKELSLTSRALKQIINDESEQPDLVTQAIYVQPDKYAEEKFPITLYYKISERGTYFITARRRLLRPSVVADGLIVANTVTLIVQ